MKKLVIFLLTLCVVTAGVLETSAVLFKNDVYAETKSTSDQVAQDSEKGARTDVSNPDLKELTHLYLFLRKRRSLWKLEISFGGQSVLIS